MPELWVQRYKGVSANKRRDNIYRVCLPEMPKCNPKGVNLMLIAIFVVLMIIMILLVLITIMMASVTSDLAKMNNPQSYEDSQAQLFKAWGDNIINKRA